MRLLVIGGVAAGLSAASRARRLDPQLEILVLEKGPVVSYGACGLPYLIEGRVRKPENLIVYTPEFFREKRNITVRTGAKVASIAHSRREVALENGERIHYDRLVIATGARPRRLGIPGEDAPHVFHLQTLGDGARIREFLSERRPTRAAVVGAGYIGIEAADALRRNGLRVTVYERSGQVLRREDPHLTRLVSNHLERFGVELRLDTTVADITRLDADIVLLSAGIQPNVELVSDAGVEVGRTGAIRVDERLQTNVTGIYAAGDCAETMHLVTGRPEYVPLGTTANKMGRIAGANAAGARERFAGIVGTSILSCFGLGVGITGLSPGQARPAGFSPVCARIEALAKPRYFEGRPTTVELVADRETGRLLGGTVIGEHDVLGRINVIAAALHNRMGVEDFEQLDLAYAPPFSPVWDPVLIAAQQLLKQWQ
jgi:CoA-dependent NAD(P)H sulfur oxidoreductase